MNLETAVKISEVIIDRLSAVISLQECNIVFDCEYGFMVSIKFEMETRSWIMKRNVNGPDERTKDKMTRTAQFSYLIRNIHGTLEKHASGRSVSEINPEEVLYWVANMLHEEIKSTYTKIN